MEPKRTGWYKESHLMDRKNIESFIKIKLCDHWESHLACQLQPQNCS